MLEVYDLRRLPEDGDEIDEPLEREWLTTALTEGADLELTVSGPGRTKLDINCVGGQPGAPVVRVHGHAVAPVETACVRCLAELSLEIRADLDLTLFPAPKTPSAQAEPARGREGRGRGPAAKGAGKKAPPRRPEPDPDDDDFDLAQLDEAHYEDLQVDLPALVREALVLALDMNPSCTDEPACAERTSAMLRAVNPPDTGPALDPRWAALGRLVPSSPQGED